MQCKKAITRREFVLISCEKFCHIPKGMVPIPNLSCRHPLKYFVLDWKPSLQQLQLSSSLKRLYHDVIWAYQGVLNPISVKKSQNYLSVYQMEKLKHYWYRGNSSSRFSQFQNTLSRFPKACLAQSNSVTNFRANMGSTKQSWKVNPCFL